MLELMNFWSIEYLGLQGLGDDMLKPFVTALVAIPLIPFLVIPLVVLSMFMI